MKNLILSLLLLAPLAFGQGTVSKPSMIHVTPEAGQWPAIFEKFGNINLDTLEIDTGVVLFNVLGNAVASHTDTLGFAGLTCKDSTGTDTIAVILKWQGNPRIDGSGTWSNIDSVEAKDLSPTSTFTNFRKEVVNSVGYGSIRFILRNKLGTNVNRKATCRDVHFTHRKRIGVVR